MSTDASQTEPRVLAIASHVTYGYVGNKVASFVLQTLGFDVAAINTVNYSNHTGYGRWTGVRTRPREIQALYDGLKQNHLDAFEMMLSGYIPTADAVLTVGGIARELKEHARSRPGSFFWALDPVMGDHGNLYVDQEVVPAYKEVLRDADLILPNQFEAELLSGTKIDSLASAVQAITLLHQTYHLPHIIITSAHFDPTSARRCVVGSSARGDASARVFQIEYGTIDCLFTGTGDLFAALMLARLHDAVQTGVRSTPSWRSPDHVPATELPLAQAAEQALASMQALLVKTKEARDRALPSKLGRDDGDDDTARHLRETQAAEVRLVQHADDLRMPTVRHRAQAVET
ncbi:MAG: putative pyridoxal kinase [Phylliscum demangeonii]|nr:MAG: putative pyridoxal kinase [Phylliscum demangeonii]